MISTRYRSSTLACALAALLLGAGCQTQEIISHGAVINQNQIDLIPIGSSKDQVLLALGTPSTTGAFDTEIFYYISQKKARKYAYQKPKLVDQRVLAVYFDEENTVSQVANYGIQDGKVFDFVSRTTPTGGRDLTFLGQILSGQKSPVTGPITPIQPGSGGL